MAQGFFAGGNGTKENPFLIEDADDLNAIRNNLSAHYKMINDILYLLTSCINAYFLSLFLIFLLFSYQIHQSYHYLSR